MAGKDTTKPPKALPMKTRIALLYDNGFGDPEGNTIYGIMPLPSPSDSAKPAVTTQDISMKIIFKDPKAAGAVFPFQVQLLRHGKPLVYEKNGKTHKYAIEPKTMEDACKDMIKIYYKKFVKANKSDPPLPLPTCKFRADKVIMHGIKGFKNINLLTFCNGLWTNADEYKKSPPKKKKTQESSSSSPDAMASSSSSPDLMSRLSHELKALVPKWQAEITACVMVAQKDLGDTSEKKDAQERVNKYKRKIGILRQAFIPDHGHDAHSIMLLARQHHHRHLPILNFPSSDLSSNVCHRS